MKKLFCQIDQKKHSPKYFIVVGKFSSDKEWSPMNFDNRSKSFCWANPSEEYHPDESIEIYDRETAMYLLGETIHSKDGCSDIQYRLIPLYTGFEQFSQLYMITGKALSSETYVPLCRGEYAPLTWARVDKKELPTPELFDINTAKRLIAIQKKWDEQNIEDVKDHLDMVIISVRCNNAVTSIQEEYQNHLNNDAINNSSILNNC